MANHLIPPVKRTPVWASITEAAGQGRFVLPVCNECQAVQYPPREICKVCLGNDIAWQEMPSEAEILYVTELNASTSEFFREHLPVRVALLRLDCGPLMYAHLADASATRGDRVSVRNRRDVSGQAVFVAVFAGSDEAEQLQALEKYLLDKQA